MRVLLSNKFKEKLKFIKNQRVLRAIERFILLYKNSNNNSISLDKKVSIEEDIYTHRLARDFYLFYTLEKDQNGNDCIILLDVVNKSMLRNITRPRPSIIKPIRNLMSK